MLAMNSSGNDDYVINSLVDLETSANELARYRQNLGVDSSNLSDAIGILQSNWKNESGSDIESIMLALNSALKSIDEEIIPAIGNYVNIINEIILETKQNQNTTLF